MANPNIPKPEFNLPQTSDTRGALWVAAVLLTAAATVACIGNSERVHGWFENMFKSIGCAALYEVPYPGSESRAGIDTTACQMQQ